ncbi:MAG: hypothetical protein HY321_09685 [Armatimonadetes bacterium]|nr:hypothetical protein [Armatimonadota bacterium]
MGDVANFIAAVKGEEDDVSPVSVSVGTMALCEENLPPACLLTPQRSVCNNGSN